MAGPVIPEGFRVVSQPIPDGFRVVEQPSGITSSGLADLSATIATGAFAEPVAGLAGLGRMVNPLAPRDTAGDVVRGTREALTVDLTPEGQAALRGLADMIPDSVLSAGGSIIEQFDAMADFVAENVGPVAGSAVRSAPTAVLEFLGLRGARSVLNRSKNADKAISRSLVRRSIRESAPSSEDLRAGARAVFKELDESGARIKASKFQDFADDVTKATLRQGLDTDAFNSATPTANRAIQRINASVSKNLSFQEVDILREVAQGVAASTNTKEAAIGSLIVDRIDNFLDTLDTSAMAVGQAENVGAKYRIARELWGRARRSELIQQALKKARNQASGFENGIRVQLRRILDDPKKSRFFTEEEMGLMRGVVRGSTGQNLAKLIGRSGFSEQGATNLVGGTIGATGGGLLFGTPGAVAVPVIGTLSRRLAQRLTREKAEFLDDVIRAGRDGKKIVVAYFKNTPKSERNPIELSQLLGRPDVVLPQSDVEVVQQAVSLAQKARELAQVSAGAAPAFQQPIEGQLETQ